MTVRLLERENAALRKELKREGKRRRECEARLALFVKTRAEPSSTAPRPSELSPTAPRYSPYSPECSPRSVEYSPTSPLY